MTHAMDNTIMIKEYQIVTSSEHWNVQSAVNALIAQGYQPYGNLVTVTILQTAGFTTTMFYQPMVKHETVGPNARGGQDLLLRE